MKKKKNHTRGNKKHEKIYLASVCTFHDDSQALCRVLLLLLFFWLERKKLVVLEARRENETLDEIRMIVMG